MRDPVGEIIAYHLPLLEHPVLAADGKTDLTSEALRRKLDALAGSPFQFFRGTFHLNACDLLKLRVPAALPLTPEGLIVGDLHLENFGIYRGQSGELCFDVNDFDDVGYGPLDVDLKRLCTSALLLPGLAPGVKATAARTIARAWADEIDKLGGRFPVPPWTLDKADGLVRELLQGKGGTTREEVAAKVAPGKSHSRLAGEKFAAPSKEWVKTVQAAVAEYVASLRQLKAPDAPEGWDVLDVAYRYKGLGSLGRLRFSALIGKGEARRMLELKEARPSALDLIRNRPPPRDRARTQTASIRRLQGDPWPRVAATHLGKTCALGRENEPDEEKIDSSRFAQGDAKHEQLNTYARQCGQVLARLHCRENAPVMFDAAWSPAAAARGAVEFAEKYAPQVEADQKLFVQERNRVAKALGIG
jgi:uncharacterized protein (DUF2252 family)